MLSNKYCTGGLQAVKAHLSGASPKQHSSISPAADHRLKRILRNRLFLLSLLHSFVAFSLSS